MEKKISIHTSKMVKGVAAMFVLFHHLCDWGGISKLYVNDYFKEFQGRLSDVGMFSFLFLSGYGLFQSYLSTGEELTNYWEKKIKRVYIPLLGANLVGAITYYLANGWSTFGRAELFFGIISKELIFNGTAWYLHYLLIWYFLFWFIYKIDFNKTCYRLCIWGMTLIIMWFLTPETYGLANVYCMAFPLGVLFAEIQEWEEKNKFDKDEQNSNLGKYVVPIFLWSGAILAFGCLIMWFRDEEHFIAKYKVNFWLYSLLANILLTICVIWLIVILRRLGGKTIIRVLTLTGEYSLGIYLLQEPIILRLFSFSETMIGKSVVALCGIIFCILLTYLYKSFIRYYKKSIKMKRTRFL